MADQLLAIQQLVAAKTQATEGTFDTGVLAAAYCKALKFKPKFKLETAQNERNAARNYLSGLANVPGANYYRVEFSTELRGSGTAGVAPAIGVLLQACGMSETINTGVEAISSATASTKNIGTSPSPVMAVGTPAFSAKSGIVELTLISKTTTNPEGAVFQGIFYPGDSTTPIRDTFTISDTSYSAVAGASGLASLTLTVNDPDAGGVGDPVTSWSVGDRWFFNYTSASQAEVAYKDSNTATMLSLGFYRDGTLHKIHSARGNFNIDAKTGAVPMVNFTFWGARVTSTGRTDTALPTGIVWEDVVPVAFQAATINYAGAAVPCSAGFSFDRNAKIEMVECHSDTTGYLSARMVGPNRPSGKISGKLAQLIATDDPYAKLLAGTVSTGLYINHGSTSGNIVQLTCRQSQIIGVDEGERQGHVTEELDLLHPQKEYDAGADYTTFSLVFK